jgi:sigma-E factor negative regulatory protein RseA
MSNDSSSNLEQHRSALSAAMDGQADACDAACHAWRGDARWRADWHAYHLIGDLMRSDEHRVDVARDADLLARVREQIRREPAVLAPAAAATSFAARRRARAWLVPTAIAAGFAAVGGALVVTRGVAPEAPVLMATPAPVMPGVREASIEPTGPAGPASVGTDAATVIRSPELDRYLAAHRQYASGALRPPGVAVRQAAVSAPGR